MIIFLLIILGLIVFCIGALVGIWIIENRVKVLKAIDFMGFMEHKND